MKVSRNGKNADMYLTAFSTLGRSGQKHASTVDETLKRFGKRTEGTQMSSALQSALNEGKSVPNVDTHCAAERYSHTDALKALTTAAHVAASVLGVCTRLKKLIVLVLFFCELNAFVAFPHV